MIGFLLKDSQKESWMDIQTNERRHLANLLLILAENAILLNDFYLKPFSENFISNPTVFAELSTIYIQKDVAFPASSLYNENQNKIVVPEEVLQLVAENGIF